MKKLLILGGTQFIGRNLLEHITGYDITLFNRQQTNAQLFPDIKKIKGDRETADIQQLTGQYWDYIIDLSCYYPDSLKTLLSALKGQIGRYIFMSTLSVYQLDDTLMTENTPTLGDGAGYGERKAACERILLDATWLDKIILRPSVIYGKYDPSDRFYYWLYRTRHQQAFILPATQDKITLTYVGDLVNILIQSLDIKAHNTIYNASTHAPLSLKEMIQYMNCKAPFIEASLKDIKPEEDMPLWFDCPLMLNTDKLLNDFQITLTPFEKSITATAAYYAGMNWPVPKAGLSISREQELIAAITR